MPLTADARSRLETMLLSMFSNSELQRLVRYLPSGAELHAQLPSASSAPRHFVDTVVDVLERQGSLDADFFQAVRSERPRRLEEVDAVATLALATPTTPPQPSPPGPDVAVLLRRLRTRVDDELSMVITLLDIGELVPENAASLKRAVRIVAVCQQQRRLDALQSTLDALDF